MGTNTGARKNSVADYVFAACFSIKRWDSDWEKVEKALLKRLEQDLDTTVTVSQKTRIIASVKIVGKASWLQLKEEMY